MSVTKFITYVQTYVQHVSLKWFCHKYKLDFFFKEHNTGTVAWLSGRKGVLASLLGHTGLLYTFTSYVLINTRIYDPFTRSFPENVSVILHILSVLSMKQICKYEDTNKAQMSKRNIKKTKQGGEK